MFDSMVESVNSLAFLSWQWREETWLYLMLLPFVWAIFRWLLAEKQQANYADKHLWQWVKVDSESSLSSWSSQGVLHRTGQVFSGWVLKQLKPSRYLAIAWLALMVVLAGPRSSVSQNENITRDGMDVLMVLDVSRSMQVEDETPNRFEYAKALMQSYINRLQPNDRLGLMVYAGKPHLVTPLTFDRGLFAHYLNLVHPAMLPTMGSQLQPALAFGAKHLAQTAGRHQVMMVWTDGQEDEWKPNKSPQGMAQFTQSKIASILVGVGQSYASNIPDKSDASGQLHINGLLVKSRLESLALKQMAAQINGHFIKAEDEMAFLETLMGFSVREGAFSNSRSEASSRLVWVDHAQPFVWLALVMLLLTFNGVKVTGNQSKALKSLAALCAVGLIAFNAPSSAYASERANAVLTQPVSTESHQAYQNFIAKEYELSQQYYDELGGFFGWFGAGASAYRLEDFASAVLYFRQAALVGVSEKQRSDALYNLGNSYYMANLLPQAIASYQQALNYDIDNAKTQHNLALAKKRRKQEAGRQQEKEQGEGQGKGSQSRDSEGAFYGGKKPDPSDPGKGVSGDAPDGSKDGKDFVLPDEEERTDFHLNSNPHSALEMTENNPQSSSQAILTAQQNRQNIESFEQTMRQFQDHQSLLLQRLFEREEGFKAAQEKSHPISGVKPW